MITTRSHLVSLGASRVQSRRLLVSRRRHLQHRWLPFVSLEREVEWLGGGYGGGAGRRKTLWWKEGEYLLFSDIALDTGLSPTLFQTVLLSKKSVLSGKSRLSSE